MALRRIFSGLITLTLFSFLTTSTPLSPRGSQLPTETVYRFAPPTWVENITVRSNGELLLTLISEPKLYSLDPLSQSPNLVHTFPDAGGLLGITEVEPDLFAVVTGNSTLPLSQVYSHNASVWTVDFRGQGASGPRVTKVAYMPEALWPNGMTTLPGCPGTVLIADGTLGAVWTLDVGSGDYEVLIQVPEMEFPAGSSLAIGINGLHVRGNYLYWTNSERFTFYRVKINRKGQIAPGAAVEIVSKAGLLMDDFTFDARGNAWVTTNSDNTVIALSPDGKIQQTIGNINEDTVAGATAAQFGRRKDDRAILYVTTSGSFTNVANETVQEGAKIVAIDTSGSHGL